MKCKIEEVWEKFINDDYIDSDTACRVEFYKMSKYEFEKAVEELLSNLHPYVELGELVFNNLIDIELKQRNDYIELVKLINQIKEQRDEREN